MINYESFIISIHANSYWKSMIGIRKLGKFVRNSYWLINAVLNIIIDQRFSGNRRIAYNFRDYNNNEDPTFLPIGLNIDRDGNLWVALYNASSIWKINPRKSKLLEKIELPTPIFTNLAIGGPNLDTMFVTTGTNVVDIYSGATLNYPLPSSSGMLIMIKGLRTKGLRTKGFAGRKLCIWRKMKCSMFNANNKTKNYLFILFSNYKFS